MELPYDGNELPMVILLPESDQFKTFEASLNSQAVNNIVQNLKQSEVNLGMPRFTFDSQFGLKKTLSGLGMPLAFSDSQADFSGMDGARDLYISDVIHKAYVSVDENGTEAAAERVRSNAIGRDNAKINSLSNVVITLCADYYRLRQSI